MLAAILSNNPNFISVVKSLSQMNPDIQIMESRHASDLIRRMTTRVAIDVIIVDAERDFENAETLVSWRACHSRMDFSVVLVGKMVDWRNMARAFESGVDDIVVGNLQVDELYIRSMRCVAHLQRRHKEARPVQIDIYSLDRRTQCIAGDEMSVQLTGQEFALASLFFSNPGVLLGRERIAATIWGRSSRDCGRTLEQAVHRLRRKLQRLPDNRLQIKAVYAQGFKLIVSAIPQLTDEPPGDVQDWPVDLTLDHGKGRPGRSRLFSDLQRASTKGFGMVVRPFRRSG